MFEQIFEEYHKAVDSSLKLQQEMYRKWMNGWPVKPPVVNSALDRGAVKEQIRSYQKEWSHTLAETLEKHRAALNEQYKSGILAIESAFRTTEAKTPEECWRLTQEFWRKSIDSYKSAFEAQSKYLQDLAQMWLDMMSNGKA
jgi:hypothetical protein